MRFHCICEILRERNAQPFDVKIKIFYIFPSSRPCLKASNVPSKKQEAYIWNMLNIFGLLLQSRIKSMLHEFIDIWQNLNCYSWNNRWNRHKGSKYSREQYGNRMGDRVSTIWEISREMLKNELRLKLPSPAASCESSGKIPAPKKSWQSSWI